MISPENNPEDSDKTEENISPEPLSVEFYGAQLNDSDYIKKTTNHYVVKAEEDLEKMLGQTSLSDIEKIKLRKIAEQCVKQKIEEKILCLKGRMSRSNMIDIELETVYRWLWELYDIKKSDIPGRPYGNEILYVPEDFREYLRRLREDSHLI